jgi:hypothetical protein
MVMVTVTALALVAVGNSAQATTAAPTDPTTVGLATLSNNCTGMTNAPNGDASKQLTICSPDGVGAGDLLLAQITFEKGSDAGTDAQLTPAGWTRVLRTNSKTDIGQVTFYRVATDVEPVSYTFPFNQAVKAAGGITRYSGMDTANPIVAAAGAAGDSNTLTAPSVDAVADSMLVTHYGFKKKDTTLSVPAGMGGRYNFQNPQDVTIRAAEELRAAGATGSRVSTPSPRNSDKWVAQNVVLRKAADRPPVLLARAFTTMSDGTERLIAQLVDTDESGTITAGDVVQVAGFPASFDADPEVVPVAVSEHVIPPGASVDQFSANLIWVSWTTVADGKTEYRAFRFVATSRTQWYTEVINFDYTGGASAVTTGVTDGFGVNTDRIQLDNRTPSHPQFDPQLTGAPGSQLVDDDFIDVEIYLP